MSLAKRKRPFLPVPQAMSRAGDLSQAEAFRAAGFRVHEVGDCRGVGYIEGAMRSAMEAVDAVNAA